MYRKGMEDGTITVYYLIDENYWTTVKPFDENKILDTREVPVIWSSKCPHHVKEGDWILTREHDDEKFVKSEKDFRKYYEPT